MATTARKTKRILTNIDFSGDKAHIALTSKENGPANGADRSEERRVGKEC